MDSKGNLYREVGRELQPVHGEDLTAHEYNVLQVTPKEDRPCMLQWMRYADRNPKLRGIEKIKAKIAFFAAWTAAINHVNEE